MSERRRRHTENELYQPEDETPEQAGEEKTDMREEHHFSAEEQNEKRPLGKRSNKAIVATMLLCTALVVLIAGGSLSYLGYVQPMKKAERLISEWRCDEAAAIISRLPETEEVIALDQRVFGLKQENQLNRAETLIKAENYEGAKDILNVLPESARKTELLGQIESSMVDPSQKDYEDSLSRVKRLIAEERYDDAASVIGELPETEEVIALDQQVFGLKQGEKLTLAQAMIEHGKYSDAEMLLLTMQDSEEKKELQNQIVFVEVNELLESGDYAQAERKLNRIPADQVDDDLKEQLIIQQANALVLKGQYEQANALLGGAESSEAIEKLSEQIAYESRIFSCIQSIKEVLKNPDSLSIYEIEFHEKEVRDKENSTEEHPVYVKGEPDCIMHYGAQNGFGGNTTSYSIFSWDEEEKKYNFIGAVDTLDEDDLDRDDDDYFWDSLTLYSIKAAQERPLVGDFDMERVRMLLKNNSYMSIKILK